MELEETYATIEEIPENYRDLYTEKDNQYVFSGVKGMFGAKERARLTQEAGGHRIKARDAQGQLASWSALGDSPDELRAQLERLAEYEATGGKVDEEAVAKLVDARAKVIESKYQRDLTTGKAEADTLRTRVQRFEERHQQQAVRDMVLTAIQEHKGPKLAPGAIEDVLMYAKSDFVVQSHHDEGTGELVIDRVSTREGLSGVSPDVEVTRWLAERIEKKEHWLVHSVGGGSNGSQRGPTGSTSAGSCFSHAGWNTTEQGRIVRELGVDKARQLAEAAGTTLGGQRPPAKGAQQGAPLPYTQQTRRNFGV